MFRLRGRDNVLLKRGVWLSVGLQICLQAVGGTVQPWVTWERNPNTIPATIAANSIFGAAGSTVTVRLSTGNTLTQVAAGFSDPTNAPPQNAKLRIRREYLLTVEADELSTMEIFISFDANWSPLSPTGRASQPKTYFLLVDRSLSADNIIAVTGTGGTYSNAWIIEVTEQLPSQYRLEDASDDPTSAAGDGSWAQIGPGRSLETNRAAMNWSVGLGRLMDGLAAGRLTFREDMITRSTYTPEILYLTAGSAVVRDQLIVVTAAPTNSILRQVKAYQTFVDIVTPSTNETELRFYLPSQIGSQTNTLGYYTNITGNPFVVWALVNPDSSGTNKLTIVERRNGVNNTNEIVFDPTSTNAT